MAAAEPAENSHSCGNDQVDAIGLFGQLLDKVLAGQKPKPPPEPEKHDDYQVAINDDYGSFLKM